MESGQGGDGQIGQRGNGLVVVLGTGGTIAGVAASPAQHVGYTAAALEVDALIAAVPALQGVPLQTERVTQLDSSDMDHATWLALAGRAAFHLARPEVTGVVVTHGTDTLEETAYLLHRTVEAHKPLVLTAAMRPATALSADGPQNLLDAVTVARQPGLQGVLVALAGRVHAGAELRKVHGYRVDAFSSGDAGVVALVEDGTVRVVRTPPAQACHAADLLSGSHAAPADWPWVEIVSSHAGARAAAIDTLVAAGVAGIVIAGSGNGSVHALLQAAALRAMAAGVRVVRSSRCQLGGVVGSPPGALPSSGPLTPVQARIDLLLDLLADASRKAVPAASPDAEAPAGPGPAPGLG